MNKKTKTRPPYPENTEPNIFCVDLCDNRYAIGKSGENMLVAICMNPSAADLEHSDKTINKVIDTSIKNGYDGWLVFNLYPEYSTNVKTLSGFNQELVDKNIEYIEEYIEEYDIKCIWVAWGNLRKEHLKEGKKAILLTLKNNNISAFHFGELTLKGEPRHPLPWFYSLNTNPNNRKEYKIF